MAQSIFTLGELSRSYGVPEGTLRALCRKQILKPSACLGRWRVFAAADLPTIEATLRQHGYLKGGA